MTRFLPHAAGQWHRTAIRGRRGVTGVPGPWRAGADPAGDGGPPAGGGVDLAGTAERGQPVTHVPQARSSRRGGRVEAGAVVGDAEHHLSLVLGQADPYRRSWRMPGGVLQRLHAAEVDGRFEVRRIAADTDGVDLDLPGCLACVAPGQPPGGDGCHQAASSTRQGSRPETVVPAPGADRTSSETPSAVTAVGTGAFLACASSAATRPMLASSGG